MHKRDWFTWTDEDRLKKWDDTGTIQQLLLSSKYFPEYSKQIDDLGIDFRPNDGEILYAYRYGGVLSSRWGYFIVSEKEPNKILRSINTAMS